LIGDISINYQEIFKKEIDSLTVNLSEDKRKGLDEIKYNIEDACAKGKISELQYSLIRK
jgi:hypothetical protein